MCTEEQDGPKKWKDSANRFEHMAQKGFGQVDSEFEKGYKHAFGVAAKVLREERPKRDLESAVIEAAIAFNEQGGYCDWDGDSIEAQRVLLAAVDALLKAREDKNVVTDS